MTLSEILPSLRPNPVAPVEGGETGDRRVTETVERCCAAWQHALTNAEVAYTAPPLTWYVAHALTNTDVSLEIRSPVDLGIALAAAFPPHRMIGHPRSPATSGLLTMMRNAGIQRYVVDTPDQLRILTECSPGPCRVVLQWTTFGEDADDAVDCLTDNYPMRFTGLRANDATIPDAVDAAVSYLAELRTRRGIVGTELHLVSDATTTTPQAVAAATAHSLRRRRADGDFPWLDITHVVENLSTRTISADECRKFHG